MKKLFHRLSSYALIALFTISTSGCFARSKPMYDATVNYDPSSPPEWKLGWQHGCESGLSAFGNTYYKSIYKFKQDVTMVKNEYYFKAWNDSFNYCRSIVNRSLAGDTKQNELYPTLLSTNSLDIQGGLGRRDDNVLDKDGIFAGTSKIGFLGNIFTAYTPGYGSTAWGASVSKQYKCDWLNRCGDDIPAEPIDVLMGHEAPNGSERGGWNNYSVPMGGI